MSDEPNRDEAADRAAELRRQAAGRQPGLLAELLDFLLHNKKWWLAPLLIMLLLLTALAILAGTGAAPSSTRSFERPPSAARPARWRCRGPCSSTPRGSRPSGVDTR